MTRCCFPHCFGGPRYIFKTSPKSYHTICVWSVPSHDGYNQWPNKSMNWTITSCHVLSEPVGSQLADSSHWFPACYKMLPPRWWVSAQCSAATKCTGCCLLSNSPFLEGLLSFLKTVPSIRTLRCCSTCWQSIKFYKGPQTICYLNFVYCISFHVMELHQQAVCYVYVLWLQNAVLKFPNMSVCNRLQLSFPIQS